MPKTAVVLFNLGGPDNLDAVQPFLFNLFNDSAIIGAPGPIRWLLAKFISGRRAPIAKEIYGQIGGRSPLLEQTEKQAAALQDTLGPEYKTFIAMRYWHPRSVKTAEEVKRWAPDRIVLLPLYPQFSTTTTGSSANEWREIAQQAGLNAPTFAVCCYPTAQGFIDAVAGLIRARLDEAAKSGKPRLLLTAHGLPKKVVAGGDPYQWQVEQSAARIIARLDVAGLDAVVCYQSRVGRLEWIGPATEDEIERAGRDGVPIVMAPIAFVSEHSETLVELDIEYREVAEKAGVPAYMRVPTVQTAPAFISALAGVIESALGGQAMWHGEKGCPGSYEKCPFR